jgi:hypothetical protein
MSFDILDDSFWENIDFENMDPSFATNRDLRRDLEAEFIPIHFQDDWDSRFLGSDEVHQPKRNKTTVKKNRRQGYSGRELARVLCDNMNPTDPLRFAIAQLGEIIYLVKSDDHMQFHYSFSIPDEVAPTISLTVLKGSLFTMLWSTLARYDDSYLLEISGIIGNNGLSAPSQPSLLWMMRGLGDDLSTPVSHQVHWPTWRMLKDKLNLGHIGVYTFAKAISHFVLCMPATEKEALYAEPMPVSLM